MLSSRTFPRLLKSISRARIATQFHRAIIPISQPSTIKIARTNSIPPRFISRFSTSRTQRDKDEPVDQELSAKLNSEIALEKDMVEYQEVPESVKTFMETGGFTVKDTPGQEEVELVKKHGNETVRVEFSISDLNMMGNDNIDDSNALFDEADDDSDSAQSGSGESKPGKGQDRGRQVVEGEEELEDDYEGEEGGASFPAHLNITIEKASGGALKIAAIAQDGMIIVQNVIHNTKPEVLKGKSAQANWESEGLYSGPTFSHLDEDLQVLFEKYLEDRGVSTALALFVPDYIEYKEQKEYLRWLENVKKFVEA